MTEDEKCQLLNSLYAAIFPILSNYETIGYNAHQRAQNIADSALSLCEEWVIKQNEHQKANVRSFDILINNAFGSFQAFDALRKEIIK